MDAPFRDHSEPEPEPERPVRAREPEPEPKPEPEPLPNQVSEYSLGEDAARFAVVSFAKDATTRVEWSYDATEINAGIDQMKPGGYTSISDGFARARQLFADDGRANAAKITLLLSDGEQARTAHPL